MSRGHGPVRKLKQKCIEPGHWLIGGRHVRAIYQGRSRTILGWNIEVLDGEVNPGSLDYLRYARDWIRNQEPPG